MRQYHRHGSSPTHSESKPSDSHTESAHCHSECQAFALTQHAEPQTVTSESANPESQKIKLSQQTPFSSIELLHKAPAIQAEL